MLLFSFKQCFGPFTMLLVEECSEKRPYRTTSSGVHQLRNTSAITVILFLKMFKIESKFTKDKKKIQKIFFVTGIRFYGVLMLKNTWAMRVTFFFENVRIESKFRKWKKKFRKSFFFLRYLHLRLLLQIVSIDTRILVLGSQWINKES